MGQRIKLKTTSFNKNIIFDLKSLIIKSYVNGELKQNGNTRDMMFKIGEILEFVSSIMTLLPGDVILTGTPEGVSRVDRGDEIKIDIETLGTQTNTVE